VCLSLWKVDDTATALLMQRFYQNLLSKRKGLQEPMGKAQALAEIVLPAGARKLLAAGIKSSPGL
jgi:CHAT domain-containing protein